MNATLTLQQATARAWDVIVIGAGPAGAAAAHGLVKQRAAVLLVEAKAFPRSKVCGGCLNLNSLTSLRMSGLEERISALRPVPLDAFHLSAGGRPLRLSLPGGWAVSRRAMDAALVQAAVDAGAEFLPETTAVVGPVTSRHRGVRLYAAGRDAQALASVVVAASGLGGRSLSKLPGFVSEESEGSRIGVEALLEEYPGDYGPGVIYMAVGRSGYVGLTVVEEQRLNVAAAVDRDAMRAAGSPDAVCEQILREAGFPVSADMRAAEWRGTIGLTRRSSRRAGERLFVVGDAAGYIEPFTGEGMAWALASGLGVTPFVLEGLEAWRSTLEDRWETRYRGLIEHRQWLCRALAAGLKRRYLVRTIIPILSAAPWLARPVVRRLNRESEHAFVNIGPGDGAA